MMEVRCLLCEEPVRLPDASPDASVRCPHCGESYELQEILNELPPELELVTQEVVEALEVLVFALHPGQLLCQVGNAGLVGFLPKFGRFLRVHSIDNQVACLAALVSVGWPVSFLKGFRGKL